MIPFHGDESPKMTASDPEATLREKRMPCQIFAPNAEPGDKIFCGLQPSGLEAAFYF